MRNRQTLGGVGFAPVGPMSRTERVVMDERDPGHPGDSGGHNELRPDSPRCGDLSGRMGSEILR